MMTVIRKIPMWAVVLFVIGQMTFNAMVWWRMYPMGYSINDAQADRNRFCAMFTALFLAQGWDGDLHCPPISGEDD